MRRRDDHAYALEALADLHQRNPLDVVELFNERAAMREYEGRMSREYAEAEALRDVREWLASSASAAPQTQCVSACISGTGEL